MTDGAQCGPFHVPKIEVRSITFQDRQIGHNPIRFMYRNLRYDLSRFNTDRSGKIQHVSSTETLDTIYHVSGQTDRAQSSTFQEDRNLGVRSLPFHKSVRGERGQHEVKEPASLEEVLAPPSTTPQHTINKYPTPSSPHLPSRLPCMTVSRSCTSSLHANVIEHHQYTYF